MLYSFGKTRFIFHKGFVVEKDVWYLTDKEPPATKLQQEIMNKLGWGRDNLTVKGANTLITSILGTLED